MELCSRPSINSEIVTLPSVILVLLRNLGLYAFECHSFGDHQLGCREGVTLPERSNPQLAQAARTDCSKFLDRIPGLASLLPIAALAFCGEAST
jgi:hypothetical protein